MKKSSANSYISQCEEKVGKHMLGCIYPLGTRRMMTELW